MDIKDVKALNERIEVIKKKKDKADMQREILSSKLDGEIAKYKESYGVDLSGEDFATVKRKIESELRRVAASIQEEYDLKLKVVSAIESGNIDEANALLGTKAEKDVDSSTVTTFNDSDISDDSDDLDDDFGVSDEFEFDDSDSSGFKEAEAPDVKGISFEGNQPSGDSGDVEVSSGTSVDDDFDMSLEDLSDEDLTGSPKRIEVDDDFDFDDISLDEDDTDDDFGFGSMLKGTKFGD